MVREQGRHPGQRIWAWVRILAWGGLHDWWRKLRDVWGTLPSCMCPQLCPSLCDLVDVSLPGSSVHGISQARILEWVAISFSRGSIQPRDWTHVSCISCIGRQVLYHLSHQGSPRGSHPRCGKTSIFCGMVPNFENIRKERKWKKKI